MCLGQLPLPRQEAGREACSTLPGEGGRASVIGCWCGRDLEVIVSRGHSILSCGAGLKRPAGHRPQEERRCSQQRQQLLLHTGDSWLLCSVQPFVMFAWMRGRSVLPLRALGAAHHGTRLCSGLRFTLPETLRCSSFSEQILHVSVPAAATGVRRQECCDALPSTA